MRSELTKIPGIGKNMAEHLTKAGFPTIESLRGKNPDNVCIADCTAQGITVDRCALYCCRLAVYYADHGGQLSSDKQNWWDWKD
ncbi:helix-hairpin-helix domain-containing protein [Sporolactobacillus shoreicorticis]|uniref:Helix-hairpin-helix domain-containing protein n=1 Tax=Sporolactobacillus shoreicorticis TaxID=1923877 RepID=A0ABW5S3Y7_9BACL|nr:helix-hairpin-helix domain-containing protein [Sporolactobacillus shoreicorticis]MCO7124614.1 helix-hairpin-helix domain-containing protein [Sporolactobacillus shoreicorticis]